MRLCEVHCFLGAKLWLSEEVYSIISVPGRYLGPRAGGPARVKHDQKRFTVVPSLCYTAGWRSAGRQCQPRFRPGC
jgi:hypothetical protein